MKVREERVIEKEVDRVDKEREIAPPFSDEHPVNVRPVRDKDAESESNWNTAPFPVLRLMESKVFVAESVSADGARVKSGVLDRV